MPTLPYDELVARSGELKNELVRFAQGSRLSKHLHARIREAEVAAGGRLDEGAVVLIADRFVLQDRLPDGRTVLESFVEQRRPPLSDSERGMVLGWHDVVEGCFEVRDNAENVLTLHNLIDDVVYRVRAGGEALAHAVPASFVLGRLVPLYPGAEDRLVSGQLTLFEATAGPAIAKAAVRVLTAQPEVMSRNPELWRRAWAMQAEARADFVDQCGGDLVVLPPAEAQEVLWEHHRRRARAAEAAAEAAGEGAAGEPATGVPAGDVGRLPEALLSADTVALLYDEVEGLNYYRNFGRLDALFADPAAASDRSHLALLREYLRDDSISPLPIRRLVERHPDRADAVFRALLRKPGFSWERDGEALLRDRKKAYVDREPVPHFSIVGSRLGQLFRSAG
jgi:hypothetical protein